MKKYFRSIWLAVPVLVGLAFFPSGKMTACLKLQETLTFMQPCSRN